MQIEKIKKDKKLTSIEVFYHSVAWTAICLSLIIIGVLAAKIIFG